MFKGGLISVGIICAGLLGVSVLEYLGRFDVLGRTILFYSVLVALVVVLYALLLSPLLKLLRLGAIISHEEASKIIGEHFPEIKDKLLKRFSCKANCLLRGWKRPASS